ncbi:pseudouridine synthase [Rheinheimera sp.]|uniref:pseudouridine synthase n=1 Tax=Rheinheimera sp. TaxID=1869214 RepID=UPI003AF412D7
MSIRLCKYLADRGLCSRRQASRLIEQGRLQLNGVVASHISHIMPGDKLLLDGEPLPAADAKQVWLYHKAAGVDCNLTPAKSDSLYHQLQQLPVRLHPVGRLDKDSCGLLLLSNDGELTQRLLHPDFEHPKEYLVRTEPAPNAQQLAALAAGVNWQVGPHQYQSKACRVWPAPHGFRIELTQGLNRQIRYMSRAVGLKVVFLQRQRLGELQLGTLAEDQSRVLTTQEYQQLRHSLGLSAEPADNGAAAD